MSTVSPNLSATYETGEPYEPASATPEMAATIAQLRMKFAEWYDSFFDTMPKKYRNPDRPALSNDHDGGAWRVTVTTLAGLNGAIDGLYEVAAEQVAAAEAVKLPAADRAGAEDHAEV